VDEPSEEESAMKRAARILVALSLAAFAVPALACGFDKPQSTTTSAPAPAPAMTTAKVEKAKAVKAKRGAKSAAPTGQKVATSY
jgi:hypothetical protein